MKNYEEIARNILESTCETDEIFEDCDMDLIDAGYLDSFAMLNVIFEIEEQTGVKLQPTDISKDDVKTVNNFVAFMINQVGNEK